MRFFSVLMTVFIGLLSVFYANISIAASMCKPDAPVRISISPATAEVTFDYSRNLRDIQKTKTDTVDPYGIHSNSITQGFMEGEISMRRQVDLDYSVNSRKNTVCLWYKSIDVEIDIDPKIVIAKEVTSDKCMHDAVMEHEKKHVVVDRELVNEYSNIIGKQVYAKLKEIGFVMGPIPVAEAQGYADTMVKFIMEITQKYYNEMSQERAKRQAYVDTLEEYERVKAMCPGFYKNRKMLYKNALKTKASQR